MDNTERELTEGNKATGRRTDFGKGNAGFGGTEVKSIQLDQWQKDFIECKDDKVLVAGRQTGKSEAQAYDNAEFAANNPGTNCLIVSKTERQAEELLIKTLNFLQTYYPKQIGTGEWRPLKSVVWVIHPGHTKKHPKVSRVMSLPVGLAGEGIRAYTIHKLSVDEAQLPPDAVYNALTPMLLTTGGKVSLTGTPQGKQGFFWKAFENKKGLWKVFHVNSEEVIEKRPITDTWPEWKRKSALDHLAKERARMGLKWYGQEYLGQFIEDLDQVFTDDEIAKTCVLERRGRVLRGRRYVLGVDVGRTIDPSAFAVLDIINDETIEQVDSLLRWDYPITKTADEILSLDKAYDFDEMGVDGGGMGAGVIDLLLREEGVRNKTVDLNNASRQVEYGEKGKKKPLLKEDMYRNLQSMMRKGRIKLLKDDEIVASLKSCQIEYVDGGKEVKIFGNDTHATEAIIRAAWLAKEKSLNLHITYI